MKQPTGTVWDTRTSRWVLSREPKTATKTVRQIMNEISGKPNYEQMNGQQLLDAYNAMSLTKRKSKFQTKQDAVKACERLWAEKAPQPAPKAPRARPVRTTTSRLQMKIYPAGGDKTLRPNSDGQKHLDKMKGEPTIGEYLSKFSPEARRTASQWLSNLIRYNLVRVE
jgi:hypothetical protein